MTSLPSWVCLLLAGAVLGGLAQAPEGTVFGTLAGTVLDAGNERPVPGAEVSLAVAGHRRITDVDGRFSFGDIEVNGPDTLVFRHLSYDSLRLPIEAEITGSVDLDFLLSPRPIELDGIDVTANRRVREEARHLAAVSEGYFWDESEFENHVAAAMHIADPLRWSGKVTNIVEGPDGYRCIVIRARAGCAQMMINNVRVNEEVLKNYAPEMIQSYVIIDPIHATTLYGTGAAAGVVVVYLKGR